MTQPTKYAVFVSSTLAYSIYYVCRLSLTVVKGPLVDAHFLTPTQLGWIGSALFYSYGLGKLVNGFLADRVDLRYFATFGLLGTALVNLCLGFAGGFWCFFALWMVNGWLQSMGAPSFVVALTRWFSAKERGTYYGLWSASHNIGEALTFILTTLIVAHEGWRAGFFGAAVAGLAGTLLLWFFFSGRPANDSLKQASSGRLAWRDQRVVLRSSLVWQLALASALMYVVRYGVNSWGIFYLEKAKHYTPVHASFVISVSSIAGIFGTVLSGWISDRCFGSDRFKPTVLMSALNTLALLAFVITPSGWRWLDIGAMAAFGFSVGALICYLGGLIAVDQVPPKVAGAAFGLVGIASYVGAGTQDVVSGHLIDAYRTSGDTVLAYNFAPLAIFWVVSAALSTLVTAWIWNRFGRLRP